MNTTIDTTGTISIATRHVKNFTSSFRKLTSGIPFNLNPSRIIKIYPERMLYLNRGAYISITDIDLSLPGFVNGHKEVLVAAAFYPRKDSYSFLKLPGFENININYKRESSELHSGHTYFFFLNKSTNALKKYDFDFIVDDCGKQFADTIDLWVTMFSAYSLTTKENSGRVYNISNIFSAAKYITKNWEEWIPKKTSKEIFVEISNRNTLPVNIIEVKNSLQNIYSWYKNSDKDIHKEICNIIKKENGSFKRFYSRKEIGLVAYAFYSLEKEKEKALPNQKNSGRFLNISFNDPVKAEGYLTYKGSRYNNYGTSVNDYVLEGTDGNFYHLSTAVDIPELTSKTVKSVYCTVEGKMGSQWISKSKDYFNVNFNAIKGRLKINKKENIKEK